MALTEWWQNPIEHLVQKQILSEADLQIIDDLRNQGAAVFMHGTGVTGSIRANSDIDFTAIGNSKLVFAGLPDNLPTSINYFSTKGLGSSGRPISIHLQTPDFRAGYLDHPYAAEYRNKPKNGGKSNYWISNFTNNGEYFLLKLSCPSLSVESGVINFTPQTGMFKVSSGQLIPQTSNNGHVNFDIDPQVYVVNLTSQEITPIELRELDGTDVVSLGLELSKMLSDTPRGDKEKELMKPYVWKPIKGVMDFVYNQSGLDPTQVIPIAYEIEGQARSGFSGNSKTEPKFINSLGEKLSQIALS